MYRAYTAWQRATVLYPEDARQLAHKAFPMWTELHEWVENNWPRAAITITALAARTSTPALVYRMKLFSDNPDRFVVTRIPEHQDIEELRVVLMSGVTLP